MMNHLEDGWVFGCFKENKQINICVKGISFCRTQKKTPISMAGNADPRDFLPQVAGTIAGQNLPDYYKDFDEIKVAPFHSPSKIVYSFYNIEIRGINGLTLAFRSKFRDYPAVQAVCECGATKCGLTTHSMVSNEWGK